MKSKKILIVVWVLLFLFNAGSTLESMILGHTLLGTMAFYPTLFSGVMLMVSFMNFIEEVHKE